ncbi:hypothetical protein D5E78_30200 [Vibrio parahaemolyticus]|nr:hypothetical protein D5E78_30200 [Vibrio parahaemolyticus]
MRKVIKIRISVRRQKIIVVINLLLISGLFCLLKFFKPKFSSIIHVHLLEHNALLRCEQRNTLASAYHLKH